MGDEMSAFVTLPMAYTVRQCRLCRKILSWPILDMADALALNYPHCGVPTDFIEIKPVEREPVSCVGDADSGIVG